MAQHLGERRRRRAPRPSRGLVWGVSGFLALNVVAVVAVVQGLHDTSGDELVRTTSGQPHASSGFTTDRADGKQEHPRSSVSRETARDRTPAVYRTRPGTVLSLRPEVALARKQAKMPTVFRVSTFNLLGASHTGRGGNHHGFATGARRMVNAVNLVRHYGVDVVGFQEMEPVQYSTFNRLTGHGWGTFPGPTLDRGSIRQSIAWRKDVWTLVSASSIPIPYFHGQRIRMPIVRLENNQTGQQVYFTNFHNPATTAGHGNNQRWRSVATSMQIAMVNNLERTSQLPVVVTGDMNERGEYFARMAGGTDMCPANYAIATPGACAMPRRMDVDWIFGSSYITFTDYVSDQGPFVRRTTDHPIVVATATLAPERERRKAGHAPLIR